MRAALVQAWRSLAAWTRSRDNVELSRQRALTSGRLRWAVLVIGLLAIFQWQRTFFSHRYPENTLQTLHSLGASGGVLEWQPEFVYFLYYLNLFPVATVTDQKLEMSRESAQRIFDTQGSTLVMDRFWTIRYGDLLKSYLYLPHAYLNGRPTQRPNMATGNAMAWIVALLALYAAFWKVGYPLLGAILVVVLASNPFQVHEVYGNNNVFGWVIITGVLMLALHVPMMTDGRPSGAYIAALPVVSGLLLATVRQIRTEPVVIGVSLVLVYLTARALAPRTRAALVAALAASFLLGSAAWTAYFDAKFREAYVRVKAAGGHPYEGPRHINHFVWHALWCGLGDFDNKYGYQWSDLMAQDYALPIMKARGFVATGYPAIEEQPYDALTLGVYWDRGRRYARTPFEVPEYIAVIREKILHDIIHDPLWYATILRKRVWRILTETTPPSVAYGDRRRINLPRSALWGFLPLAAGLLALRARSTFLVKVLLFLAPLATTALVVYSGEGTVYYAVIHLVAFAICVAWMVEALLDLFTRRVVVGVVWRNQLHLLSRNPEALRCLRPEALDPGDS